MGNSWCLDSLSSKNRHGPLESSGMPPVPLGSHGSDGSLGPLPVPGTQVGRSLDGRALRAGKRVRRGLAAPSHHPCVVCPSQSHSLLCLSYGPGEGATSQPARQHRVPGLDQPQSYPGALFPRPHACMQPDFDASPSPWLPPTPEATHPITAGSKPTPEMFLQVVPQFPQEGGLSIESGCCVTTRSHLLPIPVIGGREASEMPPQPGYVNQNLMAS